MEEIEDTIRKLEEKVKFEWNNFLVFNILPFANALRKSETIQDFIGEKIDRGEKGEGGIMTIRRFD